jgi:hypothetical protein
MPDQERPKDNPKNRIFRRLCSQPITAYVTGVHETRLFRRNVRERLMTEALLSGAIATAGFLAECMPFDEFCLNVLKVSPRTGQRYANAPNGLPVVEIGRKLLVHVPTANAWARSRMRQRNPIRRRAA